MSKRIPFRFSLIPRAKVNYSFNILFRSLFVRENKNRYSKELKALLCAYFHVSDLLLTSSGVNSLYLLLNYLPQPKVVIPSYTCKVVSEAAALAGKQIIYVDVAREDCNMTSESLGKILDSETIVIATHQYGNPCAIKEIQSLCASVGAVLIEDCAGSLGTTVDGILTGLYGDYAFFSFDSTKLLTIPSKGGCILAKNPDTLGEIEKCQSCIAPPFSHKVKHWSRGLIYLILENKYLYRCFHYVMLWRRGRYQLDDNHSINLKLDDFYKYKLAEWQAYIAIPQVKDISRIIARRQMLYQRYDEGLKKTMQLRKPIYKETNCNIKYAIQVEAKKTVYEMCIRSGVDLAFSFSYVVCPESFIHAQEIANSVLNLPLYYKLEEAEVDYVIETLNRICREQS